MKKTILLILTIAPNMVRACYSPYENDAKDALALIAIFLGTFSIISLIILTVFSFSKKYKGKSLKKWIIFSLVIFIISLVLLVYSSVRTLCGSANF